MGLFMLAYKTVTFMINYKVLITFLIVVSFDFYVGYGWKLGECIDLRAILQFLLFWVRAKASFQIQRHE